MTRVRPTPRSKDRPSSDSNYRIIHFYSVMNTYIKISFSSRIKKQQNKAEQSATKLFVLVIMRLPIALTLLSTVAFRGSRVCPKFPPSARCSWSREKSSALAATPILNDWKIDKDGRVIGKVSGHPKWKDGELISTSAIEDPDKAESDVMVRTFRGSSYQLGVPFAPSSVDKRSVQVTSDENIHDKYSCHELNLTCPFPFCCDIQGAMTFGGHRGVSLEWLQQCVWPPPSVKHSIA